MTTINRVFSKDFPEIINKIREKINQQFTKTELAEYLQEARVPYFNYIIHLFLKYNIVEESGYKIVNNRKTNVYKFKDNYVLDHMFYINKYNDLVNMHNGKERISRREKRISIDIKKTTSELLSKKAKDTGYKKTELAELYLLTGLENEDNISNSNTDVKFLTQKTLFDINNMSNKDIVEYLRKERKLDVTAIQIITQKIEL